MVRRAGMTLTCAGLAACLLAVGAGFRAGAGAASAGSACWPQGSRTLAADGRVRVYELAGGTPLQSSVYACLLSRGRPIALGVRGLPQVRVGPLALSGTLLAYATRTMGIDTSSSSVSLMDVGSPRPLLSNSSAASPPTRPESFTSVTDLQLTARGSIAWISRTSGITQPVPVYEVREQLRSRAARLLARGASVRPGSLRLLRGRVVWRDGSRAAAAPLP